MINQKSKLLTEIRGTIEQLFKNEISHNESIQLYKKHLTDLKKNSTPEKSLDHSTALLYNHSTNNLCKLSALINFHDKKINTIEYVGEKQIIDILAEISEEQLATLKENEINNISDKYNLIFSHINQDVFFATVTSSKLFNIDYFFKTSEIFQTLYNNFFKLSEQLKFDFFSIQCVALESHITSKNLSGWTCHIFAFESIHEIYGHMGIFNIHSISTMIRSQLHESFSEHGCNIFPMSLNSYIIFSQKDIMPQMHFNHKDITLPYHHIALAIEEDTSVHSVIDAFITLNNSKERKK